MNAWTRTETSQQKFSNVFFMTNVAWVFLECSTVLFYCSSFFKSSLHVHEPVSRSLLNWAYNILLYFMLKQSLLSFLGLHTVGMKSLSYLLSFTSVLCFVVFIVICNHFLVFCNSTRGKCCERVTSKPTHLNQWCFGYPIFWYRHSLI